MSDEFRKASDSMGEIDIPADALWGAQTQRAKDNFQISGIPLPDKFIGAVVLIKLSAARAHAELQTLPDEVTQPIIEACESLLANPQPDQFPVDVFQTGSGTSTNMNVNEVIASLASHAGQTNVHPNDHVNFGQSSNDVIPTAIHLSAVLAVREHLLPALQHLLDTLQTSAKAHDGVVKTGRTHLMDAMPVRLGQEIGAWAAQTSGCMAQISNALHPCEALAQGGTAVGTGVNAPSGFRDALINQLNKVTGIDFRAADNPFAAIAGQDAAAALSGTLRSGAIALSKIANDLRWMNSGPLAGIGEIELPALQPGSSIMPGKVNPVIPEAVLMACVQVQGNDLAISLAAQSGNFQLNTMLPVIAHNLLQSIELLANAATHLADKALADMRVNTDHIESRVTRNPVLVTALNPKIGYDNAARIAKIAYASGRPVLDVAAEETDLDPQTLRELLDPHKLT